MGLGLTDLASVAIHKTS